MNKLDGFMMAAITQQTMGESFKLPNYALPLQPMPINQAIRIQHPGDPQTADQQRIDAILRSINVSSFPLPIRMTWEFERQYVKIVIRMRTLDRDTHGLTTVQADMTLTEWMFGHDMDRAKLIDMVHQTLRKTLMHELDEHFLVDGVRVFEPHKDDGLK